MLFGKRFNVKNEENNNVCTFEVENKVIDCNTKEIDYFNLAKQTDPNDPILIQVQLRGSGKTKLLYDIAKERNMIYIDFSCNSEGKSTKFFSVDYLFEKIGIIIKENKDSKLLRNRVEEILNIYLYSNIIHFSLFKEIFKDKTPEFFFRYSINGGQKILKELFQELLKYNIYDIKNIASFYSNIYNDLIFAYDEIGCLVDLFPDTFLCRGFNEKKDKIIDSLRGLFHVFADSVLSLRSFRYYQSKYLFYQLLVLTGTTLHIANLIINNISAFKKEEINICSPLKPFDKINLKEILNTYFSNLNNDCIDYLLNRWIGRGRFIFQFLIQSIFECILKVNKIDDIEKIILENEPDWYKDAISKSLEYLKSYEKININSNNIDEKKILEILKFVYFDLIMKRKFKNYMISYPIAAELVQQGIMFLPSKLKKMNLNIEYIKEPISFYGLNKFFQEKRLKDVDMNKREEIENSFLKDPILELCYNDLIQLYGSEGTGYYWQECLIRFFMLSFRPIYEKRNSIAEANIMKEFVKNDITLHFYTFEGIYVIDKDYSKIEFIDYLLEKDITSVYIPDKFVGNDITFTCTKLTLNECKKICEKLNVDFNKFKDFINKLPLKRIISIQAKFISTGDAIDNEKLKYASQTCLIENSYLGKKNKNTNNRKIFENYLNELNEIINWNIGIVCIAGKLPDEFDYNIKKINNNNSHHLLGYITPLNFDFKEKLQNFLIDCCKLGNRILKRKLDELYTKKNFVEIIKMENLEALEYKQLKEIANCLDIIINEDEGYIKKKDYIQKMIESYKNKKIKL
jgi:hypothetical protein